MSRLVPRKRPSKLNFLSCSSQKLKLIDIFLIRIHSRESLTSHTWMSSSSSSSTLSSSHCFLKHKSWNFFPQSNEKQKFPKTINIYTHHLMKITKIACTSRADSSWQFTKLADGNFLSTVIKNEFSCHISSFYSKSKLSTHFSEYEPSHMIATISNL